MYSRIKNTLVVSFSAIAMFSTSCDGITNVSPEQLDGFTVNLDTKAINDNN
jgi:hypothetical protein